SKTSSGKNAREAPPPAAVTCGWTSKTAEDGFICGGTGVLPAFEGTCLSRKGRATLDLQKTTPWNYTLRTAISCAGGANPPRVSWDLESAAFGAKMSSTSKSRAILVTSEDVRSELEKRPFVPLRL